MKLSLVINLFLALVFTVSPAYSQTEDQSLRLRDIDSYLALLEDGLKGLEAASGEAELEQKRKAIAAAVSTAMAALPAGTLAFANSSLKQKINEFENMSELRRQQAEIDRAIRVSASNGAPESELRFHRERLSNINRQIKDKEEKFFRNIGKIPGARLDRRVKGASTLATGALIALAATKGIRYLQDRSHVVALRGTVSATRREIAASLEIKEDLLAEIDEFNKGSQQPSDDEIEEFLREKGSGEAGSPVSE